MTQELDEPYLMCFDCAGKKGYTCPEGSAYTELSRCPACGEIKLCVDVDDLTSAWEGLKKRRED